MSRKAILIICCVFVISPSMAIDPGFLDRYKNAPVIFDFPESRISRLADYDDFAKYEISAVRINYSTYPSSKDIHVNGALENLIADSVQRDFNANKIKKYIGYPNFLKKSRFKKNRIAPNAYIKYSDQDLSVNNTLILDDEFQDGIRQRYIDLYKDLNISSNRSFHFVDKKLHAKKELGKEIARIKKLGYISENKVIIHNMECFFTQDYVQLWCSVFVRAEKIIGNMSSGRVVFDSDKGYQKTFIAMRSLKKTAVDDVRLIKDQGFENIIKDMPVELQVEMKKDYYMLEFLQYDEVEKKRAANLIKWQESDAAIAREALESMHANIIDVIKYSSSQALLAVGNAGKDKVYFFDQYKYDDIVADSEKITQRIESRVRLRLGKNPKKEKIQAALEKKLNKRKELITKSFNKKSNSDRCEYIIKKYFKHVDEMYLVSESDDYFVVNNADIYLSLDKKAYNFYISDNASKEAERVSYDNEIGCGAYKFTLAPLLEK